MQLRSLPYRSMGTNGIGRRVRRRWKSKLDLQAGTIVFHVEARLVQPGHHRDEAETEATARVASAALDPVEALEHMLALLAGDARPMIGDGDRGVTVLVPHRHLDITHPAMSYGIVDEV